MAPLGSPRLAGGSGTGNRARRAHEPRGWKDTPQKIWKWSEAKAVAGERWTGWEGVATLNTLSPSGLSPQPPGRCADARRALPASATEVGGDFAGIPRLWGLRGSERQASRGATQRVGARWRRPSRTRLQRPLVTSRRPPGPGGERARPGAPGVGPSPEGAPPRPGRVPSASPPRESESVGPRRSGTGGRGRRGRGSRRRVPQGPWMDSAAASEPA